MTIKTDNWKRVCTARHAFILLFIINRALWQQSTKTKREYNITNSCQFFTSFINFHDKTAPDLSSLPSLPFSLGGCGVQNYYYHSALAYTHTLTHSLFMYTFDYYYIVLALSRSLLLAKDFVVSTHIHPAGSSHPNSEKRRDDDNDKL